MACQITRAALLAAIAVGLLAPPAQAAFPGANGKIAFSSTRDDPNPSGCGSTCNWEIYAMNGDGSGVTRLTNNALQDGDPAWSQDGTKIAFTRRDPGTFASTVWSMNADGSGQTSLGAGNQPSWSPDGSRITFVDSSPTCCGVSIWVANADGSGRTNVYDHSDELGWPDWSPNGQRIAFYALVGDGDIYTVNADGSGATDVSCFTGFHHETAPSWSPSGERIARSDFESSEFGVTGIWISNPNGGGCEDLTFPPSEDYEPAWSPDGLSIAFSREAFGCSTTCDIFRMPRTGGGTNLTNDAALDCCPDWQPLRSLDPYPRPGGGTPLQVPLLSAYRQCTSASQNSNHVAPLALDSCAPAALESTQLTTSTTGQQLGLSRLDVIAGDPATPADEADVGISASISDVRRASDQLDYTGNLILRGVIRLTDRASGFGGVSATTEDTNFDVPLPCTPTAVSPRGSDCGITTTADTLVPGFAKEGKRSVISASFKVMDAGADGDATPPSGCPPACGTGDERTFLDQGVFAP
jgi:Tol biopolymer transport system component